VHPPTGCTVSAKELCTRRRTHTQFQRGIVYLTSQRTHNSSEELCIHRRAHTQFLAGIVHPPTGCTIPERNCVPHQPAHAQFQRGIVYPPTCSYTIPDRNCVPTDRRMHNSIHESGIPQRAQELYGRSATISATALHSYESTWVTSPCPFVHHLCFE